MNGKALPSEVKEYIVTQLAGFSAPFEIQEQVKEIFGVDVNKQHIQYYNPHSYTGKTLISKYLELFNVRREIFLNQVQDIPIANVAVRLKRLENSWIQLIAKKNYIAANAVLEQAAKEASGFYSPRDQQLPSQEGESLLSGINLRNGSGRFSYANFTLSANNEIAASSVCAITPHLEFSLNKA